VWRAACADRLLTWRGRQALVRIRPLERRCGDICLRPSLGRRRAATALHEVLVGDHTDTDFGLAAQTLRESNATENSMYDRFAPILLQKSKIERL
jgi:hypothetical protein